MVVVQKQASSGFALTWHDSTRAFAKRDPLPAVEQTLAQLLGAKILSKLDINTADTSIPWKCTADYLHNPVWSILFSMIAVRNHLHTRTLSVTYVRPVEWLRWLVTYLGTRTYNVGKQWLSDKSTLETGRSWTDTESREMSVFTVTRSSWDRLLTRMESALTQRRSQQYKMWNRQVMWETYDGS